MIQDLAFLLELDELDARIHALGHSKRDLPAELERRESVLADILAAQELAEAAFREGEKGISRTREELTAAREGLERSQQRLSSIQTNREFEAVHDEIATHRRQIEMLEQRVAALDSRRHGQEEKLISQRRAAEARREAEAPELEAVRAELAVIDDRIAEVVREADRIAHRIGARALSVYRRLRARRSVPHVVARVDPASASCSMCQRVLPAQESNLVRRNDQLRTCQSCGAILVWMEPGEAERSKR